MKVALISSGSGSRGGGEIYLTFLAEGLAGLGWDVTGLVPDTARMDGLAQSLARVAAVIRFPFRATYDRRLRTIGAILDLPQQARLGQMLQDLPADVVHVNQQVAEDGVDLVLAAARSGKPWVSTIHVGHSAQTLGAAFSRVRDVVTAVALRRAGGHHIAVAEAARAQLAARFGPGGPALSVVHNGVPVPDPKTLAAARAAARADWGAGEEDVVVGTVGRIEQQKDPLAFVDHAGPLTAGGRVRLVWIGDGSMRAALEAYAARRQAPLAIDGWRADAAFRMAGLDVFLLPSRYEGLPLALLEAMHASLPVIAARTDGAVEAVRHGKTGLLCTGEAEWREATSRLVIDADLRLRLGAAARADALARFSTAAMARSTVEVYQARRVAMRRTNEG